VRAMERPCRRSISPVVRPGAGRARDRKCRASWGGCDWPRDPACRAALPKGAVIAVRLTDEFVERRRPAPLDCVRLGRGHSRDAAAQVQRNFYLGLIAPIIQGGHGRRTQDRDKDEGRRPASCDASAPLLSLCASAVCTRSAPQRTAREAGARPPHFIYFTSLCATSWTSCLAGRRSP
jgi:hypothetical protein